MPAAMTKQRVRYYNMSLYENHCVQFISLINEAPSPSLGVLSSDVWGRAVVEGGREAGYDGRSRIAEPVNQEARAVARCFRTTGPGALSAIGKMGIGCCERNFGCSWYSLLVRLRFPSLAQQQNQDKRSATTPPRPQRQSLTTKV